MINIDGKQSSLSYLNHQLTSITGVQDGVFLCHERMKQLMVRIEKHVLLRLVVAPGTDKRSIKPDTFQVGFSSFFPPRYKKTRNTKCKECSRYIFCSNLALAELSQSRLWLITSTAGIMINLNQITTSSAPSITIRKNETPFILEQYL